MSAIDIALAVEHIQSGAAYSGSVTAGTRAAWDAVVWNDPNRAKPTWEAIETTWAALSVDMLIAQYDDLIDKRLEDFAREYYSKGYANAVTYKDSSVPAWKLEAEYLIWLRDETWTAAHVFQNEALPLVMAGEREIPAWEEILAHLPVPTWPEGSRGYVSLN